MLSAIPAPGALGVGAGERGVDELVDHLLALAAESRARSFMSAAFREEGAPRESSVHTARCVRRTRIWWSMACTWAAATSSTLRLARARAGCRPGPCRARATYGRGRAAPPPGRRSGGSCRTTGPSRATRPRRTRTGWFAPARLSGGRAARSSAGVPRPWDRSSSLQRLEGQGRFCARARLDRVGDGLATLERTVSALIEQRPAVLLAAALALLAVVWSASWRWTRTVVTIAHEGGHALVAVLAGRGLTGIRTLRDPAQRLVMAARAAGVPAALSRDAGSYLCNYLCWRAAEAARRRSAAVAAFIHVPIVRRGRACSRTRAGVDARRSHPRRRSDRAGRAGGAHAVNRINAKHRSRRRPDPAHGIWPDICKRPCIGDRAMELDRRHLFALAAAATAGAAVSPARAAPAPRRSPRSASTPRSSGCVPAAPTTRAARCSAPSTRPRATARRSRSRPAAIASATSSCRPARRSSACAARPSSSSATARRSRGQRRRARHAVGPRARRRQPPPARAARPRAVRQLSAASRSPIAKSSAAGGTGIACTAVDGEIIDTLVTDSADVAIHSLRRPRRSLIARNTHRRRRQQRHPGLASASRRRRHHRHRQPHRGRSTTAPAAPASTATPSTYSAPPT